MSQPSHSQIIHLAGGCFWGVEEYFSRISGVLGVTSGYANGSTASPSYQEVCTGTTNHAETVRVEFDPQLISLASLINQFFKIINPFSLNRQGNDVGTQYRAGIYYSTEQQRLVAEGYVQRYQQLSGGRQVRVEIRPLQSFYPAEDYHQHYLRKHPTGYCHISFSSLDRIEKLADADFMPGGMGGGSEVPAQGDDEEAAGP